MPKLIGDNMSEVKIPGAGNFTFSAVHPDKLGATEYTLVTVVVDESGSTADFAVELLKVVKFIVKACSKSPRAENLMLRVVAFNTNVREIHGFKPITTIKENDYSDFICGGMTALYDVTHTAIKATNMYAETLINKDFDINGAVYVITDGLDNASTYTPNDIKKQLKDSVVDEKIGGIVTVLIGLNQDPTVDIGKELENFKNIAGLNHYVNVIDTTASTLGKLGQLISQSISSQSQAISSGGGSQPISFTI